MVLVLGGDTLVQKWITRARLIINTISFPCLEAVLGHSCTSTFIGVMLMHSDINNTHFPIQRLWCLVRTDQCRTL